MTDQATVSVEDIKAADAGYWAHILGIKLQKGPFSFSGREYQVEVMSQRAKKQCYMKGTQGGFSEMHMLKTLHGMIYGKYPAGVLYLFPTGMEVREFSKSRFGPLIHANPHTIGRFLKDMPGTKSDSSSLKQVRGANLYLRGATLGRKIEGELDESSLLRAITVDKVCYDELDMMDQDVMDKAAERMGDSDVYEEVFISNPTLPGFGIDAIFSRSDQRHWFRECSCGHFTSAEVSFPTCVKLHKKPVAGKLGYIACDRCGKQLGITPGRWIAQRDVDYEDPGHVVGYRWSQLTNPKRDPGMILRSFEDPPNGNLADVYRYKLGLPYVAAEDQLRQEQVLARCGLDMVPTSDEGPCAMGVDVGKIKHVVIGKRLGVERYTILRTVQVSLWEDIHDLARKYNVKSAVIDVRPYEDEARRFQRQEPYPVLLCYYSETSAHGPQYDEPNGLVRVGRTEIMDATHRMVTDPGGLSLPRANDEIKEYARQMCATAKVLETNKKTKLSVYRYRKLGDDHFRHATGYFKLAARKVAPVMRSKRPRRARSVFKVA